MQFSGTDTLSQHNKAEVTETSVRCKHGKHRCTCGVVYTYAEKEIGDLLPVEVKEQRVSNSLQSCMVGGYIAAMAFFELIMTSVLWDKLFSNSPIVLCRIRLKKLLEKLAKTAPWETCYLQGKFSKPLIGKQRPKELGKWNKRMGEAMINSIKSGDQPLPRVTQVSISVTSSTEQPPLKDKSMWSDQEKKIQKIDRLARSLLIQGLPNDIYSLIDSNKTAKDLWVALARHMLGSEYGEQDRKAAVLYEYETFKDTAEELLLDNYIQYLQVINNLKKCGYSKDNCELNFKFLNNLQPEWKQYATMMRQNKNLMDINIDALYNILKQNHGDVNDAMGLKKKTVVVTSDPLALITEKKKFYFKPTNNNLRTSSTSQSANKKLEFVKTDDKKVEKKDDEKKRDMSKVKCYNCKKEGHFAKDCKKVKVKDYEYYKKKMLLAKKDKDEQVFLAEDQKVLFDSEASSSYADDKISEVSYYLSEFESESEYETSEYYHTTTTYGLFVNNNDDQEIFHKCENFPENLIESQINLNESVVDHNDSEGADKLIRKFNHKIVKLLIEKNADLLAQTKVLKDQLQVKHVVINTHVECQEKYAKLEAERYEYMIRYSAYFDNDKQHRKQIADQEVLFDKMSVQLVELDKHVRDLKNTVLEKDFKNFRIGRICFENPNYFKKAKYLRPSLYDEKVIGLGYTLMFLTHSDEALEIEKFKRARENKIEFAYDYGNLNASYQTSSLKPYVSTVILEKIIIYFKDKVVSLLEKEKANLETIESLKSKGFDSSENEISESESRSENDCHVIEKECDQMENSKVIAPGMFKLSASQNVSPISMAKTSCASNNVESKLKRKRRKRKLSKQNDKQVNNNVLHANRDFVHFSDLDTFSSVRRPKSNGVIWKKKGSSNTSNVDLSSVNHLKLNKDVKRYSRKDLLSCNNSHLGETSSALNVSCNSRLCDSFDENNLFIFDDESVRISPFSKMPFRKKPRDSMNVHSKSNSNKFLPRTVHRWLPNMQPLAEPVAKWFPRVKRQIDKISKTPNSSGPIYKWVPKVC
nr:hypothetical protein [Tanacetum cinerariifolium]